MASFLRVPVSKACNRASFPIKSACIKGVQSVASFPIFFIFLLVCKHWFFFPLEEKYKEERALTGFFFSLIEIFSASNMFNVVESTDVIALIL